MSPLFAATTCTGQTLLPDIYEGLRVSENGQDCIVKIENLDAVMTILANVTQLLLIVAGLLAIGFVIAGGIFYIISFGEPAKIKKAKDTITNAILGLMVTLLAYAIVSFISGSFS